MTTLPEAPPEYTQAWAAELTRSLELALEILSQPANKFIDGDGQSAYAVSQLSQHRVLDDKATAEQVRDTLGTLIDDLKAKGTVR